MMLARLDHTHECQVQVRSPNQGVHFTLYKKQDKRGKRQEGVDIKRHRVAIKKRGSTREAVVCVVS